MRFIAGLVVLASVATAAVLPFETSEPDVAERDLLARDAPCNHGPTTRACWTDGYSIATDFDQKHPTTGATVSYQFTITNGTCNPDGHGNRLCLLVNGQYPGPPIVANWGDMVSVTFTNKMKDNGTAIHFHGLRQLNTCGADGVPGVTQCPIAPGTSYTYTFQATQFGTSWYHSHWSSQYGDGLVGPIILNGPASANYDIDLGSYPVSDWYYQTVSQVGVITRNNAQNGQGPPPGDTILINGTNKDASGNGKYSQVSLTPGKKHRLRLINTSVDAAIRVSLDNHVFQVITSDFIPIKPFYNQSILLAIGQRYDVIIEANQTASNYWLRANVATDCASSTKRNALAIFTYNNVAVANPTSTAFPAGTQNCADVTPAPFWNQPIPSSGFKAATKNLEVSITKAVEVPGGPLIFVWALNQSINVQWERPTLSYFFDKDPNYTPRMNVFPTLSTGSWNYWIINTGPGPTTPPIPHPIHLHGHDFFVLGAGTGNFDASSAILNFQNPPRRDTATLPGGGWLALAWNSNNAGAWLMHCHIAFHIGEGLGVQFTEAPSSTVLPDRTTFNQTCASWNKYYSTAYYKKNDSGL